MGDPLPHDERIGQAIYNMLRPVEEEYSIDAETFLNQVTKYKATICDKLFNLDDSALNRMLYEKFWCTKCKENKD
jgi:hypothetical protein